ncbi:MAG: hypothetical protein A4E35_01045 [Methanoregula sp. PtaU1.Bin051]|nr:MAG: hypothetical protein A4E35_01045 [Methanoregula sp. PtaU1.Bin051]
MPKKTPEEKAREIIDNLLEQAGWRVQDLKDYDPTQALGIAVREFPFGSGEGDYALFVDRKAVVDAGAAGGLPIRRPAGSSKRICSGFLINHVQEKKRMTGTTPQ